MIDPTGVLDRPIGGLGPNVCPYCGTHDDIGHSLRSVAAIWCEHCWAPALILTDQIDDCVRAGGAIRTPSSSTGGPRPYGASRPI